ncbi:hypothetical protein BH24CHL5_BH24CHL5_01380 [soil metagenome]
MGAASLPHFPLDQFHRAPAVAHPLLLVLLGVVVLLVLVVGVMVVAGATMPPEPELLAPFRWQAGESSA